MWTTLKVNPKPRPNGHTWYQSSYSLHGIVDDETLLDMAKARYQSDRLANNDHLIAHIDNGNYIIERTPS
jgi:hypothetical protein